ncbi:MAG: ComF family protein [Acidimicrobiia bacterium]
MLSAFEHSGAAATLVQHLKYRRNLAAAGVLAKAMASLIEWAPACLVPVPRSVHRRMRYGVDQTTELANRIGSEIGVPVHQVLAAPLWRRRHAGRGRSDRSASRFQTRAPVPEGAVLIDDVVTTGRTVHEALSALGDPSIRVVTATSAGTLR